MPASILHAYILLFDMRSGYHHIELSNSYCPGPFGLAQAPAYFQRLVDEVLTGLDFTFEYLYGNLVFSPDIKIHLKHLEILFQRLREADLQLKKETSSVS